MDDETLIACMATMEGFPGRTFFDAVYEGAAPWDIGAPQPDLIDLIESFPPRGRILDLGCGTGDLAIALAREGHSVLGVDFAPAAIDVARTRLLELSPEQQSLVELRVGDALHPSEYAAAVGSAVDSGFFHLFDAAARLELVGELARALPRGGRYYMLGFAIELPIPDVPRQVTPEELARLFSGDGRWTIQALRPARFKTRGFEDVPSLALCAERIDPTD